MAKILLVEDDREIAQNIVDYLQAENHLVEHVEDGEAALVILASYRFDLIVLDFALPGIAGNEVARRFRDKQGDTRILMLTGKTDIQDKMLGFDAGVDDYLTKPFDARELSARVRALLRRPPEVKSDVLTVRDLAFNTKTAKVMRGNESIKLAAKELALLEFLLRRKDEVFALETLLDSVWHFESGSSLDAVRQTIKRLRDKIDREGEPSIISTVVGLGYTIESGD